MKHAILGAGAIGGLVGTMLASFGEDVIVLVRPEKLASYPRNLSLERPSGSGPLTAPAKAVASLNEAVDVLWIATKTYQLQTALQAVQSSPGRVVPLLNGVDHIAALRRDLDMSAWSRQRSRWKRRGLHRDDLSSAPRSFASISPAAASLCWEPSSHAWAILDSPASSFRTSKLCCGASSAFSRPLRW